jgi:mannose/fructose-specific phosphotransferase system component IIA
VTGSAVRGILVTHGRLGAELCRTAEAILGPQADLIALSNTGLSAEALSAELRALLPPGERAILFVDLLGGSCGNICSLLKRERPNALLASGVNLPMLLEFLVHRGRVDPTELKERLQSRAVDAIRCIGWEPETRA